MSRRGTPSGPKGPPLIDRVIGYLSPKTAFERSRYRAAASAVGGFSTARRRDRRNGHWVTGALSSSADADTLVDLPDLRAQSRDLVRNDGLAQSAVSTKVVNVVGTGHRVRPEVDPDQLGLTETQAEAWGRAALDIWQDWAESQDCDLTRMQDFAGLEDLVYRSRLLSGDCVWIERYRPRRGRLLGTAIQVVEADRISNPNRDVDRPDRAGGIEMDADGAPIAVHVASHHDIDTAYSGAATWQRIPVYDRSGRRLVHMVHGERWRPDMTRFAPMLAPVIAQLKDRSRYSEAELVAAVVSACFAIGMKSPDGGLASGLPGTGTDGATVTEGGQEIKLTDPGQVFDLGLDEEIQTFSPGRPNPQFAPFVDALAQEVGAGTDVPVEMLLKSFNASYSASRAALEMAWSFFRVDRARHVSQFCKPAYEAVIAEAVARGLLDAPGFFGDPLRRRAWLKATWMGPARPTIDPVKDAQADEINLNTLRVTSRTRIAAERFGADYRDIARRRAQDEAIEPTPAAPQPQEGDDP